MNVAVRTQKKTPCDKFMTKINLKHRRILCLTRWEEVLEEAGAARVRRTRALPPKPPDPPTSEASVQEADAVDDQAAAALAERKNEEGRVCGVRELRSSILPDERLGSRHGNLRETCAKISNNAGRNVSFVVAKHSPPRIC